MFRDEKSRLEDVTALKPGEPGWTGSRKIIAYFGQILINTKFIVRAL
jgi:hypothetical protein